jgi:endonuclease III
MSKQHEIAGILIDRGNELFSQPYKHIRFTGISEADELINNLDQFPHAFVLACVMDRQIKAERAWLIPYIVSQELGGFHFEKLKALNADEYVEIFTRRKLHRFNELMAQCFYDAICLIDAKYGGDASRIWSDHPRSATIVRRFLQFHGVGVKISTMAANILTRDFKIPLQDRLYIDISPDIQVMKVFRRLGFISEDASTDELIFCARELYPKYPGIFDFSAWEIGRQWCKPQHPDCRNCYLSQLCPASLVKPEFKLASKE